jgi:hypothetical protein
MLLMAKAIYQKKRKIMAACAKFKTKSIQQN